MIESLLLWLFGAAALGGALLMLVLRHPMRVALALVATMLALGGIYALLGVHVIAVFQVLIYVGAVMVFMVYVIMLIDTRDASFLERYSRLLLPGLAGGAMLAVLLVILTLGDTRTPAVAGTAPFTLQAFSAVFVHDYWLYFELTTVLLVIAVVAAIAVVKERGGPHG
jgi:NADH-quinone oxidoreductase subunit J